jgi:hypothetical protein
MPLRALNKGRRGLSALLAVSILLGSLTIVTGVCIIAGPDRPVISLDVCHPLQSFNLASTPSIVPPAARFSEPVLCPRSASPEGPRVKLINLNFPPDPPPPKTAA